MRIAFGSTASPCHRDTTFASMCGAKRAAVGDAEYALAVAMGRDEVA